MEWYYIVLIVIVSIISLLIGLVIYCYFMTFHNKKIKSKDEFYIPPGEMFENTKIK